MTTEKLWWVQEYAGDIHLHLRYKERKRYLFRGQSRQLDMRTDLIDWMDKICVKLSFCTTVQHLAVYLLDIFMDNHTIHRDHVKMVAVGCLMVAVKVDEQDNLMPKNSDWNSFLNKKYKLKEFVQIEVSVLTFFKWDILFPTVATFTSYFAQYASDPSDTHNGSALSDYSLVCVYVQKYIDYFLEVTLQDHKFLQFFPSLVAAAIVASTRLCLTLTPPWSSQLQSMTFYKYSDLKSCIEILLSALERDMCSSQQMEVNSSPTSSTKERNRTPALTL